MFSRSRMIVLLLFILAFGAGLSVAQVFDRSKPQPAERGPSWLSSELNLTAAQRQNMLNIWDNVNRSGFDEGERRREIGRQRSEAIRKLIPEDQQHLLDQINEEYARQMGELSNQRRQRFEEAMEKTRAVLTPQQLQKYDVILQRRQEERRRDRMERGGPGMGGERGGPPDRGPRPDRPRRGGPMDGGDREAPLTPPATQPAV